MIKLKLIFSLNFVIIEIIKIKSYLECNDCYLDSRD